MLENVINGGLLEALKAKERTPEEFNHDPLLAAPVVGVPLYRARAVRKIIQVSRPTLMRYVNCIGGVCKRGREYYFTKGDIAKLERIRRDSLPGRPLPRVQ